MAFLKQRLRLNSHRVNGSAESTFVIKEIGKNTVCFVLPGNTDHVVNESIHYKKKKKNQKKKKKKKKKKKNLT